MASSSVAAHTTDKGEGGGGWEWVGCHRSLWLDGVMPATGSSMGGAVVGADNSGL
jgi:hypothetical protein